MAIELDNILGLYIRSLADNTLVGVLRHGNFTIGRAHDNDLVIDEPTVSAYHAKIYTYLTASYIEDLNSTNGTFVDGKRIASHILRPGNVIRMGKAQLRLEEASVLDARTSTGGLAAG